jgi:hypothetical protein
MEKEQQGGEWRGRFCYFGPSIGYHFGFRIRVIREIRG